MRGYRDECNITVVTWNNSFGRPNGVTKDKKYSVNGYKSDGEDAERSIVEVATKGRIKI